MTVVFSSNPGTERLADSEEKLAMEAARRLLDEAGGDSCKRAEEHDYEGRYAFVMTKNGIDVAVDIPGVPLERLRFVDGGNPWNFMRLYIDGSSWLWPYAVSSLREAWTPEPPIPPKPAVWQARVDARRAAIVENARAFRAQVDAQQCSLHDDGGVPRMVYLDLNSPSDSQAHWDEQLKQPTEVVFERAGQSTSVWMPPISLERLQKDDGTPLRLGRANANTSWIRAVLEVRALWEGRR